MAQKSQPVSRMQIEANVTQDRLLVAKCCIRKCVESVGNLAATGDLKAEWGIDMCWRDVFHTREGFESTLGLSGFGCFGSKPSNEILYMFYFALLTQIVALLFS